ncbi:MAG: hypothetical protein JKY51_05735 [Opitutaceae bacterium]|nr:hypothetical protein [Opitutaceae bacterium]
MGKPNRGGAPFGNHNRANGLEWKLAIKRALARKGNGAADKVLLQIATQLVECALDSTNPNFMFAVTEIGNRLDGKPREHVDMDFDTAPTFLSIGISDVYTSLGKVKSH